MGVRPDAEVLRADAPIRGNGRSFRNDGSGASNRPGTQVDEVPVRGETVDAGVLTHGRDHYAVRQFHAAKPERIE